MRIYVAHDVSSDMIECAFQSDDGNGGYRNACGYFKWQRRNNDSRGRVQYSLKCTLFNEWLYCGTPGTPVKCAACIAACEKYGGGNKNE